jgi:MFS family permease
VTKKAGAAAAVAWLVTAIYYLHQYALRSAPAVMMPQLSEAFGLSSVAVASLVGIFYYGYSPFSLVAGAALDRFGPRRVVPVGAAMVGTGALLFSSGVPAAAAFGRFLQGAGGAFALIGALYIASRAFAASRAATLDGAAQMFGMTGGSAGQFVVGPMIAAGVSWRSFWVVMGFGALAIAALLVVLLPGSAASPAAPGARAGWVRVALQALGVVFRNPQSVLCGLIAGLLMMPTSIFDMVWGVQYMQEGHGFDYPTAVLRSATVPLGWIVGCPLLGFLSDRLRRRKPVILAGAAVLLACLAWILFGRPGVFPPGAVGFLAGLASGSTMMLYTVAKEANRKELAGSAAGVVNFINFTLSALLGPVFAWGLRAAAGGDATRALEHYRMAFSPLLFGVALAIVLTLVLKETGPGARTRVVPGMEMAS